MMNSYVKTVLERELESLDHLANRLNQSIEHIKECLQKDEEDLKEIEKRKKVIQEELKQGSRVQGITINITNDNPEALPETIVRKIQDASQAMQQM